MAQAVEWNLNRYRSLLRLLIRQYRIGLCFQRRFDSSDLIQETLLRAHAHRHQFQGATEPELIKWLQRILANTVADEVRKARAKKRDLAAEQSLQTALDESSARLEAYLANPQAPPGLQAERHELLLRIAEALDQLPEDQRNVVIHRDLLGASIAQIADQLGRTEKSIAGLLLRGRSKLRELLVDYQ
jgi:RNA polymerase sigma-70 factor (ECF subfamily)